MKPKILILGSLPPPYIGPNFATKLILNSTLQQSFNLIHLDTSDHRDLKTLGVIDLKNIYLTIKHYGLLLFMILKKNPDMIYIPISQTTIGYLRDAVFILISKLFRKKVICHLRGGNFKNWLKSTIYPMQWFVHSIHSFVDGQIVLGENLKHLFFGLVPDEKIFVVPNGRNFNYDYKELNKYQNSKDTRILFLANLIETKGYKDLLFSVRNVVESYKNIIFTFAGTWLLDEDKRKCQQYITKENIEEYVNFVGIVNGENKWVLLHESDIFVFPTYYPPEGHPWVIVEAMAAGLPIISTDQGAITESVIDGANGFIVEKQKPQQIAEKIKLLIENPKLRIKMGKESRRLYEENFTEEKMVMKITDCFNKVLDPYDIKEWYDSLADKWGIHYALRDKHFQQRFRNVHLLVNPLTEPSNILDIGCASGEITASLQGRFNCNTVGIDISEKMIELCRKKYSNSKMSFQLGDIKDLHFQNDEFDLVVSLSVIEWISEYEQAIEEVSRVLKTDGQWVVSLPNWSSPFRKFEKLKKLVLKDTYLRYQQNQLSLSEFEGIAKAHGLKKTRSIFHVMPFYGRNFSDRLGPLLGMMCMMSMTKV